MTRVSQPLVRGDLVGATLLSFTRLVFSRWCACTIRGLLPAFLFLPMSRYWIVVVPRLALIVVLLVWLCQWRSRCCLFAVFHRCAVVLRALLCSRWHSSTLSMHCTFDSRV